MTRDQIKGEAGALFDKAFANPELIEKAAKGVNATFGQQMADLADPQKMDAMRNKWVDHIMDNMMVVLSNFQI